MVLLCRNCHKKVHDKAGVKLQDYKNRMERRKKRSTGVKILDLDELPTLNGMVEQLMGKSKKKGRKKKKDFWF